MGSRPLPELGILFRGDMVRAILARKKRVTRRAMTKPTVRLGSAVQSEDLLWAAGHGVRAEAGTYPATLNRHGAVCAVLPDGTSLGLRPGEFDFVCRWGRGRTLLSDFGKGRKMWTVQGPFPSLWVRETWAPHPTETQSPAEIVVYRADRTAWGADVRLPAHVNRPKPSRDLDRDPTLAEPKWRPSLLMPRWASRITLRVTDVRAERLTEITPEDVVLEGLPHAGLGDTPADYRRAYREMHELDADADPWVWRIAFEVVDGR